MAGHASKLQTDFRSHVFDISEHLKPEETEALGYILGLPEQQYKGKPALTVLRLLEQREYFSAQKPEGLADVLKRINRMDLVKKAKEYAKSAKRKNHRKGASATDKPESHSQDAHFDVSFIQTRILIEELEQLHGVLQNSAAAVRSGIEETQDIAEQLMKKLKAIHQTWRGTGSLTSDDEETKSLGTQSEDGFQIYEELKPIAGSEGLRNKPLPLPKPLQGTLKRDPRPPKQTTDEIEQTSSRAGPKKQPLIPPLSRNATYDRKLCISKLRPPSTRGSGVQENSQRNSAGYSSDFTGGSECSSRAGSFSDDSGFCDARKFLKCSVKPTTQTNAQTTVDNDPPVAESTQNYYKSLRFMARTSADDYESIHDTETIEEATYMDMNTAMGNSSIYMNLQEAQET